MGLTQFLVCGVVLFICYWKPIHCEAIVCPNGLPHTTLMAVYNKRCLQFVSAEKYWDDARDYCWQNSGHMVIISDWQTNEFIVKTLNDLKQWKNRGVWIGLHDENVDLHWQWVTNSRYASQSLIWSNWGSGHPAGIGHTYRNCVRMVRSSGWRWHETACHMLLWKYRFICEYESKTIEIVSDARVQAPSVVNQTRSWQMTGEIIAKGQRGVQDANIPGARRSSPFSRSRQSDIQKSSDEGEISSNAIGNAEYQTNDASEDTQYDKVSSAYWRYFVVIGIVCICLVLAFSFMLALLLVRLWRVKRRDNVQTIDSLAKNRIWRVMNTSDTDAYGSHQRIVCGKAPWENDYILDDSRAFSCGKCGSPPWDKSGLLKMRGEDGWVIDRENERNAYREVTTELLTDEKRGGDDEHVYESIDEVHLAVEALRAAEADKQQAMV